MHIVQDKSVIKLHIYSIMCTRQEEHGDEARFPKVTGVTASRVRPRARVCTQYTYVYTLMYHVSMSMVYNMYGTEIRQYVEMIKKDVGKVACCHAH